MLPLDAQGSRTSSRLALTGATPLLVAAEKATPAQGGKNYPPADGHALFIEAVNLFGAGRYAEAIVKFTAAYNSPTLEVHGLAANQIGTMYLNGKTVPHDGPLALKWLTRAAELHNHTAEHTLVQMYAVGQDAPKDDAKVAAYARASAEAGDPTGQIDYAICYEKGFGVPMQQGTAIYWLEKAAAQKSPVANLKIGVHFADGAGVNRDDNAARQYYNVALAESTDANLTRIINGNLQALDQRAASEQAAAAAQAAQQAQAAQAQVASNQDQESTVVDNSARIAELQSDIEMQEADAARSEASANELASGSNCYGPGAPACQMIGNMGAAKERKDANRARNQADRDREEIQRLEGEQVEVHQRRTTSFGDTLTQTTQEHPTPTINDTLAQQQQALQDIAVAKQQQQQQQQQQQLQQQQQQQQQIALAARQQTLSPPAHTSPRPVRSVNTTPAPGPAAPATPYTPPSAQPNAGSASALSSLVAPRDNSCIFQSYDSSEYGWLALRNDCGESLHVTWKSMSLPTKIFAASDIAVGTSISSGLSHAEVQAAGGLLLFVCPVGYAPVTPSMKSVGDEPHVSRFSCQPQ